MKVKTQKLKWAENELSQNTYILEFENCCVVVDAGIGADEVKKISNKPIAAVLITHGHFDHVLEIESYDKLNVPIYAHKNIIKVLSDEHLNASSLFGQNKTFNVRNIKLVEDDEIFLGGHRIKCIHTPGHSIDGMCYVVDDNLFSGDTLFSVAIGRTDLPKSNKQDMIESLKFLQDLDFENMFAGHGRVSNKQEQTENIKNWLNILDQEKTLN